jgi:hypothetical protein
MNGFLEGALDWWKVSEEISKLHVAIAKQESCLDGLHSERAEITGEEANGADNDDDDDGGGDEVVDSESDSTLRVQHLQDNEQNLQNCNRVIAQLTRRVEELERELNDQPPPTNEQFQETPSQAPLPEACTDFETMNHELKRAHLESSAKTIPDNTNSVIDQLKQRLDELDAMVMRHLSTSPTESPDEEHKESNQVLKIAHLEHPSKKVPALAKSTPLLPGQTTIQNAAKALEHSLSWAHEQLKDTNLQCPVCLESHPEEELAQGRCAHSFCVPCLEMVLRAEGTTAVSMPMWEPKEAHLSVPTLGRCPICRTDMNLMEIQNAKTGERLYEKDYNILESSPLKDQIYVPFGRANMVGLQSFHFAKDSNMHDSQGRPLPYINFEGSIRRSPEKWILQDSNPCPSRKSFEEDCYYHAKSRTFHGKIKFDPPLRDGCHRWDLTLAFAKDFRFIASGILVERHDLVVAQNASELSSVKALDTNRCQFPLDGNWIATRKLQDGTIGRINISVERNSFRQGPRGSVLHITFQDPTRPCIYWPNSPMIETSVSGANLKVEPNGPEVGGKIFWETTNPLDPDFIRRTIWTRVSVGEPLPPRVIQFGSGDNRRLYMRLEAGQPESSTIPSYNRISIWGNVFVRAKARPHTPAVGRLSYHFISPEQGAYISYEHPACRQLPKLDDGSPLPPRVYFHNFSFDPAKRTFQGMIEWEEDLGSSWTDNVRWKCDMTFDSDFTCIISGGIAIEYTEVRRQPVRKAMAGERPVYIPPPVPTDDNRSAPPPTQERNEEWKMSYTGEFIYFNAAILERFQLLEEQLVSNGDSPQLRFLSVSKQISERLESEGASKSTIEAVEEVLDRARLTPGSHPIDFNIL